MKWFERVCSILPGIFQYSPSTARVRIYEICHIVCCIFDDQPVTLPRWMFTNVRSGIGHVRVMVTTRDKLDCIDLTWWPYFLQKTGNRRWELIWLFLVEFVDCHILLSQHPFLLSVGAEHCRRKSCVPPTPPMLAESGIGGCGYQGGAKVGWRLKISYRVASSWVEKANGRDHELYFGLESSQNNTTCQHRWRFRENCREYSQVQPWWRGGMCIDLLARNVQSIDHLQVELAGLIWAFIWRAFERCRDCSRWEIWPSRAQSSRCFLPFEQAAWQARITLYSRRRILLWR